MTYAISDLHGCYNEFIKMLELINFNKNDTLYIIGDICDRGPDSMKILLYINSYDNIIPIYGNHDINAFNALSKIGDYAKFVVEDRDYVITHDIFDHDEYLDYLYWLADGGDKTLLDFSKQTISNKKKILECLSNFRDYTEIELDNKKYVLIHSGFKDFDKNKELFEYRVTDFTNYRLDYNKVYYDNKIIVSGHTPTALIDEAYTGKIIIKNNHIAIDCGIVFGYRLGLICLDTLEEFYVDKID